MARLPRLAAAGELHHVLQRGHNGQPVFADETDRAAFAEMLREATARHGVAIHAYALLDAEVHLLATPAQARALGRLMQSLGRRYGAAYNRRHARRGTLWDGRFRTSLLDVATVLLDAMLYIECLPVRAELAALPWEWRWSSAAHHLGRQRDPLVTDHALYWELGNTPFDRESAHALRLSEACQKAADPRFAAAILRGQAVGPAAFVARMTEHLARPLTPRARGRPVAKAAPKKTVPK